jgi:peptide methionine sulfoxide reductase MsrA
VEPGDLVREIAIYAERTDIAEEIKREVDASGKWREPVVTEIASASEWYGAEDYHQDYLQKHPDGYTCHYIRD